MIKVILMLAVLICTSAGGEIAMTYGMKRAGELEGFHPRSVLRFLGRAVKCGWVWLAVPLLAVSFYSLLILLSWAHQPGHSSFGIQLCRGDVRREIPSQRERDAKEVAGCGFGLFGRAARCCDRLNDRGDFRQLRL